MARKSNYPTTVQPDIESGEIAYKLDTFAEIANWEFTNDPEKVEQRIKWFFKFCADRDQRPTVELLATALNTSRQTIWGWEQRGGRLGNAVSQAKRIINALLTEWGAEGKMNPIYVIWSQKNNFGYRDSVSVEMDSPRQLAATLSPEQIAERIARDIPIDDVPAEPETADIVSFDSRR